MNYIYTLPLKSDEVKKNFNKNKKGVKLHLFLDYYLQFKVDYTLKLLKSKVFYLKRLDKTI